MTGAAAVGRVLGYVRKRVFVKEYVESYTTSKLITTEIPGTISEAPSLLSGVSL